jgi:hypothetical protein
MSPRHYIVALDFESAGGVTNIHGFTQLGAVLMCVEDGEQHPCIATFNMHTNMEGFIWEERCVREFWEEHPEQYQRTLQAVKDSCYTPYQVIEHFFEWLDAEIAKLPEDAEFNFISDNVAYDIGILRYFSKRDIMYAFRGVYRKVFDVTSFYNGMTRLPAHLLPHSSKAGALNTLNTKRVAAGKEPLDGIPTFPVTHDHDAIHDAETIARNWIFFQRELTVLA